MITSVKISTILRALGPSSRRLSAMTPPKAETGSQAQRLLVSLGKRCAEPDAAWVGVLDDRHCGAFCGVEFGHELVGRIGVVDVVVG